MSEKRIVGVDIGTYAVKVVYLDPKGELSIEGVEYELVGLPKVAQPPPTPKPVPAAAPEETYDDEETTGVREVPSAPSADETEENAPELDDEDVEEIEVGPAWHAALTRLANRGALSGEYVVTFVPDGKAMTIQLEVPFAERAKAQSVLPHLMLDRLPLPQSEIVWDFQTYPALSPDAEGARALVGFAKNDDVAETIELLHQASLDPVLLGIPELFLASIGIRCLGGPLDEPVAFVDLGHETTRVVVVQGYDPLLARTIRSGGRQVTEAIADGFNTPFDEAEKIKHQYGAIVDAQTTPNEQMRALSEAVQGGLRPVIRDLRRSFQGLFAKERIEVGRVFICGGTSQIRNIEKHLSAELGVQVRRLQLPAAGISDPAQGSVLPLALAAGMVHNIEPVRQRSINLRRGRFAYRGKSSYLRRQMAIFAAAVVLLGAVLVVALLAQKQSYEAQRDAMRSALSKQTKTLFGAELTSKDQIQKAMAGEESQANAFVPKMSAYQLLHELTTNVSKDITMTLDRIEVDADRNLVQVYGETTDAQAVDKIVSDLEQIKCLKEIKKDKLKVRDDKADFELQISSECS